MNKILVAKELIKMAKSLTALMNEWKKVRLKIEDFKSPVKISFRVDLGEPTIEAFFDDGASKFTYEGKQYNVFLNDLILAYGENSWDWRRRGGGGEERVFVEDPNKKDYYIADKSLGEKIGMQAKNNIVSAVHKAFDTDNSLKKIMVEVQSAVKTMGGKDQFREDYFSKIKVPAGFQLKKNDKSSENRWDRHYDYELTSPEVDVKIWVGDHKFNGKNVVVHFGGTLNFVVDGKEYSFDRRGINDSFYGDSDEYPDINKLITEQIAKGKKAIEDKKGFNKTAIDVPEIGYRITPEKKEEISKLLKSGKSYTFAPSGMGTAYEISTKGKSRFDRRSRAIGEFFGVPYVFVSNIDWD